MKNSTNAGYEVSLYHDELERLVSRIMDRHTARKGCRWRDGAMEAILCDLTQAIERQEICQAAA